MRGHNRPLPTDIHTRLERARRRLCDHPAVIFAYLFGGLARGEPTPLSDVDIAVYPQGTADASAARLELIGIIVTALATDEVDLVILNQAPLSLAGRIQQTSRLLVDNWLICRIYFGLLPTAAMAVGRNKRSVSGRRYLGKMPETA